MSVFKGSTKLLTLPDVSKTKNHLNVLDLRESLGRIRLSLVYNRLEAIIVLFLIL